MGTTIATHTRRRSFVVAALLIGAAIGAAHAAATTLPPEVAVPVGDLPSRVADPPATTTAHSAIELATLLQSPYTGRIVIPADADWRMENPCGAFDEFGRCVVTPLKEIAGVRPGARGSSATLPCTNDAFSAVRLKGGSDGSLVPPLPPKFNLTLQGNRYDTDYSTEIASGDFDGDGRTDVFVGNGTAWFFSRGGSEPWEYLRPVEQTRARARLRRRRQRRKDGCPLPGRRR